jgi:hypothetical protein
MKISFGNITLANGVEYGETPFDFKILGQRMVQMLGTVRGAETRAVDRGNLSTHLEFRVRKKHDTAEEAQNYAICHASQLRDLQTDLTIVGEPSNTLYYLKNAVVSSVESSSNGNTSEHFYKIVGGAVGTASEME